MVYITYAYFKRKHCMKNNMVKSLIDIDGSKTTKSYLISMYKVCTLCNFIWRT